MPDATREALILALPVENVPAAIDVTAHPATVSAAEHKPLSQFSTAERDTATARKAFVLVIQRMEADGLSRNAAINKILDLHKAGKLPTHLQTFVTTANARYGGGEARTGISRRRLYEWCSCFEKHGDAGLVPSNPQKVMTPPAWLPVFLCMYQRPQKPSVQQVYDEFVKLSKWVAGGCRDEDWTLPPLPQMQAVKKLPQLAILADFVNNPDTMPSVYAVRRWLDKVGNVDLERGRVTGNALVALRPCKSRHTENLLPTDWYTADGTTADIEVTHPLTGHAFKPEITFVIDVKTHKCVGAAVDENENSLVVLRAVRMACCAFGVPAALYSDNGPGYKNEMLAAKDIGILVRLGITPEYAMPRVPQGKGLMEKSVQILHERLSKSFVSCTHTDMDKDAARNVYKISRKEIKAARISPLLPQWGVFMRELGRRIDEYNSTPSKGLPKFKDANGKVRNYSPNEYWQKFVDAGFTAILIPPQLQDDLLRPAVKRRVSRGSVKFARHTYFSTDLEQFNGDLVEVRYNEWDCTEVSVWTLEGRKICHCGLNDNATAYVEQSVVEQQRNRRALSMVRHTASKLHELMPNVQVELPKNVHQFALEADTLTRGQTLEFRPRAEAEQTEEQTVYRYVEAPIVEEVVTPKRDTPTFNSPSDKYMYYMQHVEKMDTKVTEWMQRYVASDEYADLLDYYEPRGLTWREQCVSNL